MSYEKYVEHCQKIADVQYSNALLQWDQEVNMPEKGADGRSRQIATLSVIAHEWSTDAEYGQLLESLSKDESLSWEQKRNVEVSLEEFKKHQKYNSAFVKKMSSTISKAFNAWQAARKANNFQIFVPALEKIIALKREEAALLGFQGHPYNALLNEYEPGATVAMIDELFVGVKSSLLSLLDKINSSTKPVNSFAGKKINADGQWKVSIEFLKKMGYDFKAGRQDYGQHPFCTNFNSNDVRVTTRANEDDIFDMLSSSIHEGGHALYEQGLLYENYGLPAGAYISLGIHESQSRLWENNVGRSKAFWKDNFSILEKSFPEECIGLSSEEVFLSNNIVEPTFIRVQADELTYHFHVMIRYELEKRLMEGSLEVKDLKDEWNNMYRQYLGIEVTSDNQGVLQDVHWSHGLMGYFPTYSLGSFYAAQFYHQATKDIPNLEDKIASGDLLILKEWLNKNIHQYGKLYGAEEICKKVTGEGLNFDYFYEYLSGKLAKVYGWED